MPQDQRDEDALRRLAAQVDSYHRQADGIGRMLAGRSTLACPDCELREDILADMSLVTTFPERPDDDTGMRFQALDEAERIWLCPACGARIDLDDPAAATGEGN